MAMALRRHRKRPRSTGTPTRTSSTEAARRPRPARRSAATRTCRAANGSAPSIPFPLWLSLTWSLASHAIKLGHPGRRPPLLNPRPRHSTAAAAQRPNRRTHTAPANQLNRHASVPSLASSDGVAGEDNGGGRGNAAAPVDSGRGPAQLRRRPPQEHPLLRGPAVRPAPARPARPLAARLGAERRRRRRGGPDGRVLRRGGQRQVRVPDGIHDDAHVVGAHRLRQELRVARRGGPGGGAVGDGLPDEGDGDAQHGVRAGRGRLPRPLVLGAARGHGHPAHRLQGGPPAPWLRRRRRDRRRPRRRLHRLPRGRPRLLQAPPRPRHLRVRVRGQVPWGVQQQPVLGGVPLLLRLRRVPGRAAVGGGVAAQGVAPAGVPRLHQEERGGARRQRLHQRVRLGQQARRHQHPHLQGGADGQGLVLQVVPGERRQLHLHPPPRHLQPPPDRVLPRWPAVQGGQQQHAARDVAVVPAARLRQLRQPRQRAGALRRLLRLAGRAPPRRQAPGGLHPGRQPAAHVVHGGVRGAVPAAHPPPRELAAVGVGAPGPDRLQGRRRILREQRAQPQPARGRRRGRAQQHQRQLPRRAGRLPAVRAHHLHQRPAVGPPRLLLRPPQPAPVRWHRLTDMEWASLVVVGRRRKPGWWSLFSTGCNGLIRPICRAAPVLLFLLFLRVTDADPFL